MKNPLVIALIALALVTAYAAYAASQENYPVVWVNTFDECESSSEFGELFAPGAITWFDAERTRPASRIPHGTRVEIVTPDPDFPEVRHRNATLYIASTALSDYDPSTGVRPDPSACAS
jgi:nitroreductase